MLYDRPYMRDPVSPRENAPLAWLIGAIIVAFIGQQIAISTEGGRLFVGQFLPLTRHLADGYVWTLVTYGFLHQDLLHILLNVLGIYLLGRALLPLLGTQRFVGFFFGAMIMGGLTWFIVAMIFGNGGGVLGVSAVCCGFLAVFGTLFGDARVGFLLIPVTVKAKHMALGVAGVSFVLMAIFEIPGRSSNASFAHSAHLGGMLAGWIYGRYIHHRSDGFSLRPAIELPAWMRRRKRAAAKIASTYTVNVSPPAPDLRAEVDRILDKINSQGFGSLTEDERRVLDDARDLLNKR